MALAALQSRSVVQTQVLNQLAPWRERAANRDLQESRRLAGDASLELGGVGSVIGHRRQKPAGVRMAGVREDVVDSPLLDELAEVHHHYAIAEVAHDTQVVADEQEGHTEALLQIAQEVENLRLDGDVQTRHDLVADDQLRLEHEGTGETDALPLAAAELPGIAVQVACGETYLLEHARCLLASLRSVADAVDRKGVRQRLADRHRRAKCAVRILEHVLDPASQLAPDFSIDHRLSVERDHPRRCGLDPHEHPRQRALAAPALADQPDDLARRDGQAHPVDRMNPGTLARASVVHDDVLGGDDRLRPRGSSHCAHAIPVLPSLAKRWQATR